MKLNYGKERYDDRCDCYDYGNKCCDDHKYAKCCPKNPCPYPILFECTGGTGGQITTVGAGTAPINVPLGCVTIDTTCLKNPVVKFDFCALVKFVAVAAVTAPARIAFTLFKQCDEGAPIACGSWNLVFDGLAAGEVATESVNFCHCECNSCPGCCTYSVVATSATNIVIDQVVIVESPVLSVIAKSAC